MDPLVNTAISGIIGAVVAALIAVHYQRKSQKRQLVLSLIDSYLKYADLRVHVRWIFDSCSKNEYECIFPSQNACADQRELADRNYNKLIQLGDWYELTATLYRTNSLDNYLFDVSGLRFQVNKFRNKITALNHDEMEKFKTYWPQLFELR